MICLGTLDTLDDQRRTQVGLVALALAGGLLLSFWYATGCKEPLGPPARPTGNADRPPVVAAAAPAPVATVELSPAAVATPCPKRRNCQSPLGTNLTELTDYSGEWAFVDAFKQSRPWISSREHKWDDGRPLDLDEHGWVRSLAPGQWARTLLFWGDGVRVEGGDYVVLFDGNGDFEYWNNAELVEMNRGRHVVRVKPDKGGIGITIKKVDPNDYPRNIRVIMPGGVCSNDSAHACRVDGECGGGTCRPFEQVYRQQIFHPVFLQRLAMYRLLRFMPWQNTNNSEQRELGDRPLVTDARWTDDGVPLEIMTELANRLGTDAWFTVPHLASNDYIAGMARIVRDKLAPELRVYVEYSNEVWNGQFRQSRYAAEQGQALGLSSNRFTGQLQFYAKRALETFAIWKKVFRGKQRLVRVMASQAANAWVSRTVLEYQNAFQKADALAIAPYFGGKFGDPERLAQMRAMTLDQALDLLEREELPRVTRWIASSAAVAKKFGLPLISYEGGQHLVGVREAGKDDKLNSLFDALNKAPRMKSIYSAYLQIWKKNGGQLFVHYLNCGHPGRYGRWGALEYLQQPATSAPKFAALQAFAETPPWW